MSLINKPKNPEQSKKIKKQLVSAGVYIALAAAVVGITSNSVKKILDGADGYEIPNLDYENKNISLPELSEPKLVESGRVPTDLPPQTEYEFPSEVTSENASGISAEVNESDASENLSVSGEPDGAADEPIPAPVFDDVLPTVRVRPVNGYIGKEFSEDELIYAPTMNDFRTHDGVDIVGDIGTPVSALADGTVADVYDDPFMGTTVVLKHSGGLVSSYSNLSAELPQEIYVGASVSVGDTIGGIGETALIESAEVPHVHVSIFLDEHAVDPEEYLPGN